jgi:hypothetical protein
LLLEALFLTIVLIYIGCWWYCLHFGGGGFDVLEVAHEPHLHGRRRWKLGCFGPGAPTVRAWTVTIREEAVYGKVANILAYYSGILRAVRGTLKFWGCADKITPNQQIMNWIWGNWTTPNTHSLYYVLPKLTNFIQI